MQSIPTKWLILLPALMAAFLFGMEGLHGQTRSKIELLGAKDLMFDKRMGVDAQRLIGDVKFRHQGALMFCDSAYLYNETNSLDAFGNVKVTQGDTLDLFGDFLNYNGDSRLVKVRNNVKLVDKEMTLTTHILDYNRNTNVAVFYDRGTIVSEANDNTLLACEGVYVADADLFHFRDSVVLINPQYRVETDTLDYNNATEVAYFDGPTFIFSDANTIYCENGWYDTKSDVSQFNEDAYLDNGKQVLKGDSLWYSRSDGLGRAYMNVSIIDTTDKYLINGHYGQYYELESKTVITDRAELIQYDQIDSLFLHADTLMAVEDSVKGNLLFAYHGARFFRKDMQGAADSMYFARADSIIYLFHQPVLWSDDLQITGDTMEVTNTAAGLDRLLVYENSLLIDRVDSAQYNQIKGRRLTGYFEDNELYEVLIQGNGQSLYYAIEETKGKTDTTSAEKGERPEIIEKVIGVNLALCSNIAIYLEDRRVKRIRFLVSPDGRFVPIHLFDKEEAFLDGFTWQEDRRPVDRSDIFRKPDPIAAKPEGEEESAGGTPSSEEQMAD